MDAKDEGCFHGRGTARDAAKEETIMLLMQCFQLLRRSLTVALDLWRDATLTLITVLYTERLHRELFDHRGGARAQ